MSTCIFVLFDGLRQGADDVPYIFVEIQNVLTWLVGGTLQNPPIYILPHAGVKQQVTIFYDHLYGLYIVKKQKQPIEYIALAEVQKIAMVLAPDDQANAAFNEWVETSPMVGTLLMRADFDQFLMHVICNKILCHSQPMAHPLVTLMLTVETWCARLSVQVYLEQQGADKRLISLPWKDVVLESQHIAVMYRPTPERETHQQGGDVRSGGVEGRAGSWEGGDDAEGEVDDPKDGDYQ